MDISTSSNVRSLQNQTIDYKVLLRAFIEGLKKFSIETPQNSEEAIRKFQTLGKRRQKEALMRLGNLVSVFNQFPSAESNRDIDFFKAGLDFLGFDIDTSVISAIGKNDIAEIYDSNFVQVFGNLNFMKSCSYSIAELLTYEWWELFHRSEDITQKLADCCNRIFQGKPQIFHVPVKDHFLKEKFSSEKKSFIIKQKIIAPVRNKQKQVVGVLGVIEAKEKNVF